MTTCYDIVLLPSKELAEKTIAASNATRPYDSYFLLEDGKFYPHVSLYMFQLEESAVAQVRSMMNEVAAVTPAMQLRAVAYVHSIGYTDIEYEKTDQLHALQNTVVENVNPIRSGDTPESHMELQVAANDRLKNLQQYGYSAIGEAFRPHITLTRLKEHDTGVLDLLREEPEAYSGRFDRIGLFEMGPHGTCVKQIDTWDLAELPTTQN